MEVGQRCDEEHRETEIRARREGGIGFDTNKSIQRSRKVPMRKRGRDRPDEKKSSFE